ncbi:MAG: zf-HC2 domain-containing protein [Clostridiales bacterium]|jgi:anti-sigma factor RsiW/VIT1/CCC1 family predicted Fe2+/Mn2+ transporter|nr:zf-HC2 domain-containing protein [Clostridiales bacterium]
MECTKIRELFSSYIDGALTDGERSLVESHTANCGECLAELNSLKELTAEIKQLGEFELPENYHGELMVKIRNSKTGSKQFNMSFDVKRLVYAVSGVAAVLFVISFLSVWVSVIMPGNSGRAADQSAVISGGTAAGLAANYDAAPKDAIADAPNGEAALRTAAEVANEETVLQNAEAAQPAEMPESFYDEPAAAPASAEQSVQSGSGENENVVLPEIPIAPAPSYPASLTGSFYSDLQRIERRMIIEIKVEDITSAVDAIDSIVGYNTSSQVNFYNPDIDRQFGTANITRRVGELELNYVRSVITNLGEVISESENQTNHSAEYNEYAIMASNSQAEIGRLSALIQKSGTLENIVFVQNRISDVSYQMDSYLGLMRQIESYTGDVFVEIRLSADKPYVPVFEEEKTFSQRIGGAFSSSISFTLHFFQGVTLLVVSAVVPLSVLAVVVIIVAVLVRKKSARWRK